jgi:hypothetical protein
VYEPAVFEHEPTPQIIGLSAHSFTSVQEPPFAGAV